MNKLSIQTIEFIGDKVSLGLSNHKTYLISKAFYELYLFQVHDEISLDILDTLDEYQSILNVYKKALYYLSFHDYSAYKLKQKLSQYDEFYIDKVIELLIKKNLINDYEYAYHKTKQKIKKNFGLEKIEEVLRQEHIDEHYLSLIRESVNEEELYYYAYQYAYSLYEKNHTKSQKALELSLYQKLKQRGYSNQIIEKVKSELTYSISNEQELVLLNKEYQKVYRRYIKKYQGHLLKNKIIYFLQKKGFNYDQIKEVVEENDDDFRS